MGLMVRLKLLRFRFGQWLEERLERCPRCHAPGTSVIFYFDGDIKCTQCGYQSFKDKR